MNAQYKKKLKNAVHYICRKMGAEPDKLGLTKLHKILWMTDVKSFQIKAKAFTGGKYIRMDHGPFMQGLNQVLSTLVNEGKLYADKTDFHGYEKARLIGKGAPDTSLFSERELRWLDEHIDFICYTQTATTASDKTHGRMWRLLENGEPMPFEAEIIRFLKASPETIKWAKNELGIV